MKRWVRLVACSVIAGTVGGIIAAVCWPLIAQGAAA